MLPGELGLGSSQLGSQRILTSEALDSGHLYGREWRTLHCRSRKEVTSILLGTGKTQRQLQYPRGAAWPLSSGLAKGVAGESGVSIVW